PTINKTSLPSSVSLLLKQAVINLNNPARGDIEFTMYAFPVLKALEGVLKFNLSKCNIPMNKTFDMFDKDITTDVYFLKTIWKNKLDVANVTKLENCYNHLYNNRHTLFHFGIIIGGIDSSTRILKTKEEANLIIKDTLEIIDNNYIN
ncbi:MAG: RNase LS family HEPN domain-containing protein, partial [Clostridia bacterium]|nr:RNase LS family HEPN domain-containing protein [Clostridia bacterium]